MLDRSGGQVKLVSIRRFDALLAGTEIDQSAIGSLGFVVVWELVKVDGLGLECGQVGHIVDRS